MVEISHFHSHIYFDLEHGAAATKESASELQQGILAELGELVRVHGLIDEPIGPHPLPMFEVDIPAENIKPVKKWLAAHRGPHSILVHPLTGDELADHRDYAQWIGPALPLNLEFLEEIQRRKGR